MQIYSVPDAVPVPTFSIDDLTNGDYLEKEEKHSQQLKEFLVSRGYNSLHTGRIYSTPMADGHALYMYVGLYGHTDQSFLVHLPYGDAWHSPDVEYIDAKEIISRMDKQDRMKKLFSQKS